MSEGRHPAWLKTLTEITVIERNPDRDAHIVASGLQVWLDDTRIHRRTLNTLLSILALSAASDVKGLERYQINGVGRALVRRPELADEIALAVHHGGAWTLDGDRLVQLDSLPATPDPA